MTKSPRRAPADVVETTETVETTAKAFTPARAFTDGASERYFAAGEPVPVGRSKGGVTQADAERFVAQGLGTIG